MMPPNPLRVGWRTLAHFAGLLGLGGSAIALARPAPPPPVPTARLEAVHAIGIRTDTLLVGGYARGSFREAMRVLASELREEERAMVGQHLDKIFLGVLEQDGLGRAGRLRVAFERAVRPDGTTRSIRVLTAEAAVGGELHTAFFHEREGKPGYFDPFGRSLEEEPWAGPLTSLRVTSPFGSRRMHPILGRVLPHAGVDYAARSGTPVRATADGVVSVAEVRGGYGKMVEVQHPNGYSTRYAHLSAVAPGVGRARLVRQGDLVGYVGMTGLATGPHLHYEVRRNGRPLDPTRIAAVAGVPQELSSDDHWPLQRTRLSRLLARTPSVLRMGRSGDG